MEVFEVQVKVRDEQVKLFVIPFDIPEENISAGYLLVLKGLTLGSISIGTDGRWYSEDELPWTDEDLQLIGDAIGYFFISSVLP